MPSPLIEPGGISKARLNLGLNVAGDTGNQSVAGATTQAATVGLAADTQGRGHTVGMVWWSYSGTPVGGRLTVATGAGNYVDVDIPAGGPGSLTFTPPLTLDGGSAATITLAAGGTTGCTAKVGVNAWRMK